MYMKQNLSEFSLVIGRWKSDMQARYVRGRCSDSFQFLAYHLMKQ